MDETYFGASANAHRRRLERILGDYTSQLLGDKEYQEKRGTAVSEGTDAVQQFESTWFPDVDANVALKKSGSEALHVAKAWCRKSTYDAEFGKTYTASLTFLATPPIVETLPFPNWLLQLHVSKTVEVGGGGLVAGVGR